MNTQELIQQAENLVAEVKKTHRYSMSRIYELWNEIFEKSETPQSCASCLIRKMADIKGWLEEEKKDIMEPSENEQPVTPSKPQKKTKKKK